MHSASTKNNIEFMNNIGAYRLKKKNENLYKEGEVRQKRNWMILRKPELICVLSTILFASECCVLIKQKHWDHEMTRKWTTVKFRQSMNAAKHLAHLRLTCKRHDSSQMSACLEESCWTHTSMQRTDESLCHSLPLRVPSCAPRKCGGFPL